MIIDKILEFFFPTPRICPICQEKQHAAQVCDGCLQKIKRYEEQYGKCGRCGTYGIKKSLCRDCMQWPQYYHGNVSAMPYIDRYRDGILRFKFQGQPWVAKALAETMVQKIKEAEIEKKADIIVAVPLYHTKRRQRGFNQSELLAKEVAKLLKIPYQEKVLKKTKDTLQQSKLSRTERLMNVKDVFAVEKAEKIQGKSLLLIDDIITTGTTLSECAKVLHDAGAKEIYSATLASGMWRA